MIGEIPGYAEAVAALREADYPAVHLGADELATTVLQAATGPILAAAFADVADALTDDASWADGPVLAAYLDAMSHSIRERMSQ